MDAAQAQQRTAMQKAVTCRVHQGVADPRERPAPPSYLPPPTAMWCSLVACPWWLHVGLPRIVLHTNMVRPVACSRRSATPLGCLKIECPLHYKYRPSPPLENTPPTCFTLHTISGSVPLGACHLVVIENREGERRGKSQGGVRTVGTSSTLYLYGADSS